MFSQTAGAPSWTATGLTEGDMLTLPEIGIEVPVAELYRRIEF